MGGPAHGALPPTLAPKIWGSLHNPALSPLCKSSVTSAGAGSFPTGLDVKGFGVRGFHAKHKQLGVSDINFNHILW